MELVAEYAPAEDLLALRSTCRNINGKILRVFAQVQITRKTVFLAYPRSMDILEDISEHPTFGGYLTTICLSLLGIHDSQSDKRRSREKQTRTGRRDMRRHREGSLKHEILLIQQRRYLAGNTWRQSLARILEILTEIYQREVHFEVCDGTKLSELSPTGTKDIERQLGYQGCLATR